MGVLDSIQVSPVYSDTILSTKKKFKYRGYNAGQEQALLTAKESEDVELIIDTTKQVIKECCLDSIDVDTLASFDIEWLLLKLRSKSVGEDIELSLICKNEECGKTNDTVINIDDIKKPVIPKDGNVIKLTDDLQLIMKYPGFDVLERLSEEKSSMFSIVAGLIQTVVSKEKVIETVDLDPEEVESFVKSMSSLAIKVIVNEFIMKIPKITHNINIQCEHCKKESEYKFEGIRNFFV